MRVLFIDDNAMNRAVVKSMLEPAGVVMAEAPDAETGLAMIAVGDYDLILMDLRMPGIDGMAAIRRLRARGDAKAGLPVVMVTADSGPDIRREAEAAGADDLLHKPVEMTLLFDTIGRVLTGGSDKGAMLA